MGGPERTSGIASDILHKHDAIKLGNDFWESMLKKNYNTMVVKKMEALLMLVDQELEQESHVTLFKR